MNLKELKVFKLCKLVSVSTTQKAPVKLLMVSGRRPRRNCGPPSWYSDFECTTSQQLTRRRASPPDQEHTCSLPTVQPEDAGRPSIPEHPFQASENDTLPNPDDATPPSQAVTPANTTDDTHSNATPEEQAAATAHVRGAPHGAGAPTQPGNSSTRRGEDWRCFVCREINTRKALVECHTCKKWAHLTCVNLRQREAAAIPVWNCAECRGVSASQPRPNQEDRSYDLTVIIPERRSTHRTVHFIPRGARPAAADGLTKLLRNVVSTNSQQDWLRLLCYPLWALYCPPSDSAEESSLATRLKRQIATYMTSEWLPDALPTERNKRNGNETADTEERLRRRISKKFQEMDIRGAIRLLASTEGLAPFNEETLAKLQERHPPGDDDALPHPLATKPIQRLLYRLTTSERLSCPSLQDPPVDLTV